MLRTQSSGCNPPSATCPLQVVYAGADTPGRGGGANDGAGGSARKGESGDPDPLYRFLIGDCAPGYDGSQSVPPFLLFFFLFPFSFWPGKWCAWDET